MDSKEVVTLQIGKFASHAGAHFWNVQDEIAGIFWGKENVPESLPDSRVLYHELNTSRDCTYKPRLLALDFRGQFGSIELETGAREKLNMTDDVIRSQSIVTSWNGLVDVHREERVERTKYLQLLEREANEEEISSMSCREGDAENLLGDDESASNERADFNKELDESIMDLNDNVKYWTDYLKVELHASNILEFPSHIDAKSLSSESGFGSGIEMMSSLGSTKVDVFEDISDRLRKLVEECDLMQGIHLFADDWGGYAGIAACTLSEIISEYAPRPIFLFAVRSTEADILAFNGTPMNALNEGMAIAKLYGETSFTVPLHLPSKSLETPYYCFDGLQPYHVGALAGAIIDTATLPYRIPSAASCTKRSGLASMRDYERLLHASGGPMMSVSCSFPAEVLPAIEDTDDMGITRLTDLRIAETSHEHLKRSLLTDMSGPVWRFYPQKNKSSKIKAEISILRGARTSSGEAASQRYAADCLAHFTMQRPYCTRRLAAIDLPIYLPSSFPRVLKDNVGCHGELNDACPLSPRQGDVESCSMLLHLTALPSFSDKIRKTLSMFSKASRGFQGRAILKSWDMTQEDIDEVIQKLDDMVVSYDEANAEDFNSDDDDDSD